MLENIWILPLIMAVASAFTLLLAKRLRVVGHLAGLIGVSACLILSIVGGIQWNNQERLPVADAEAREIAQLESMGAKSTHTSDLHLVADTQADSQAGTDHADSHDTTSKADTAAADSHATDSHNSSAKTDTDSHATDSHDSSAKTAAGSHGATDSHGESGHEELTRVPVVRQWKWAQLGEHVTLNFGTRADGLALVMLFTVCLISLMVHIFSIGYLKGDSRYNHFFASLALFTGAMMLMVTSSTTLGLMFGWELMGLCSFLLIGHWWEDRKNSRAALKAFFTTRTGDIGLLVGIVMLFFIADNTFDIAGINYHAIESGKSTALMVACSALLIAVIGKSAQFPLHTWLPDAMAGPTPASALIHAATMVVAGVYLVLRLYPTFWTGFNISGGGWTPIAVVGAMTVITAALLAFVQHDLKKVLAYSTVSQLGYMVMALGVGGWVAALFHLFTHAFFKALLFLGAGSVSEGCHHTFDMREMGGLRTKMPITYKTFMVGTLALCGVPPLAGFFSKDEILLSAGSYGYATFMWIGFVGAALTTMYMTRATYLTFFGEYRGHAHPHESKAILTGPLLVLTVFALVAGFANVPFLHHPLDTFVGTASTVVLYEAAHLAPILPFSWSKAALSVAVVSAAFAIAYMWNVKKAGPQGITKRNPVLGALHTFLEKKYYLDHVYEEGVVAGVSGPLANATYWSNQKILDGVVNGVGKSVNATAKVVYSAIDQKGIDGLVNGAGISTRFGGGLLRKLQTGQVQMYAAWLIGAAALIALAIAVGT